MSCADVPLHRLVDALYAVVRSLSTRTFLFCITPTYDSATHINKALQTEPNVEDNDYNHPIIDPYRTTNSLLLEIENTNTTSPGTGI